MNIIRHLTSTVAVVSLSTLFAAPASATMVNHPGYHEEFEDDICGIAAHVEITADDPVIETGHISESGYPDSVASGHVVVRFTNPANGHWTEDGYSGPARVQTGVPNADGSFTRRAEFSGIKRIFDAWDGTAVTDRGRLVVDYLLSADEDLISRTEVSRVGDFPIATGTVTFCGFMTVHLA